MQGNEKATSPDCEQAGWKQREGKAIACGDLPWFGFPDCVFFTRSLRTWLWLIKKSAAAKWAENSRVENRHTNEGKEQEKKRFIDFFLIIITSSDFFKYLFFRKV